MSNKGFHREGIQEVREANRVFYAENKKYRTLAQQKKWGKRHWFKRNMKFECQLYRGEGKYPLTEELTCMEISIRNRKLAQDFIKRLDKDENALLWVWRFKDIALFRKARKEITAID